jgi:hypothetical protein
MALKKLLRPSNRKVRFMVGFLLVGLFCIQCIPAGPEGTTSKVIAKGRPVEPEDTSAKLLELARTDHIALLNHCMAHYDRTVEDYTCTLMKQERIRGAWGDEQEVSVKFRQKPFSVAMKFVRNAPIGDRVIYVEGKYDNKMLVRPKSGILRMLTGGSVFREPAGAEAMKKTLRPVNLFGFRRGTLALIGVYEQAKKAGHLKESYVGTAEVAGRQTLVLERFLPPEGDYPAWRTLIYVDTEYLVPICIEGWDWAKQRNCRYVYKDIQFNVGLTDDDFLPEANGIKVPEKK